MQHIEITVTDGKSNHDYQLHDVTVNVIEGHDILQAVQNDTGDLYGFPLQNVVVFHMWETK